MLRLAAAIAIVLTTTSAAAQAPAGSAVPPAPSSYTLVDATQPTPLAELYGESISPGRYLVGGVLGTLFGLGMGHAVNGHYESIGWLFTGGELGSLLAAGSGLLDLVGPQPSVVAPTAFIVGALMYGVLRIWEAIDVWVRPLSRTD